MRATVDGATMLITSCRDAIVREGAFSGLQWAPASIGILHDHRYISYALPRSAVSLCHLPHSARPAA